MPQTPTFRNFAWNNFHELSEDEDFAMSCAKKALDKP